MATVAGETQVVLAGASNAGLLQAGTLRGLATTGKKRSPMFPDMPSIGEFYPGYDLTIWIGLFGPPGLPEPIVPRLRDAVQSALAEPEIVQKLNVTGKLEPLILTPADFSDLIRARLREVSQTRRRHRRKDRPIARRRQIVLQLTPR